MCSPLTPLHRLTRCIVLAALCVGVGISGPQEWLDLFGSPFVAYSVQGFWGYVRSNPRCARSDQNTHFRVDMAPVIKPSKFHQFHYLPYFTLTYLPATKICAIIVVTKVLHCPTDKPYTAFVFLDTVFLILGLVRVGGEYIDARQTGFRSIPILSPSRPYCLC